jgi:hypothetical protein
MYRYFIIFFKYITIKLSFSRDDWVSSSHLKAVDVWILLCYLEVFFALIEYCLVLYLIKGDYYWKPKANQVQNETNEEAAAEYVRTLVLLYNAHKSVLLHTLSSLL